MDTNNYQQDYKLIWDKAGNLLPLNPKPKTSEKADVAAIIVNRNRPDLADSMVEQLQKMGQNLKMDIYVIEMGSDKDNLSKYCSLYYSDEDFRGKCYGHNVGLRLARAKKDYDYYWILMNDLVFDEEVDAIEDLVNIMKTNPKLAIISPTEREGAGKITNPIPGQDYHLTPNCDYLSLLIRSEVINKIGFLNPVFKYCWGAIVEIAYKVYSKNSYLAYCDKVNMKHLGGTTYGKAKKTVSREEYKRKAKQFAVNYFLEHYGNRWDQKFKQALPNDVVYQELYSDVRKIWESSYPKKVNPLKIFKKSIQVIKRKAIEVLSSPKSKIVKQIKGLDPWYYEVKIDGVKTEPGIGSKQTATQLNNRVKFRTPMLVGQVQKLYDFKGKKLLDIASNCAFWSARYAELGATNMLAIEGRLDYVEQGKLYWNNNSFMKPGNYKFIQGNVLDEETWQTITNEGPFDFTLCCGILYHIPNYEKLLDKIDSITKEAILIDTRVSDNEEAIEEPGGWCFDAISETKVKTTPKLNKITQILKEKGYNIYQLNPEGPTPDGLLGADDYNKGLRTALLAKKATSLYEKHPQ